MPSNSVEFEVQGLGELEDALREIGNAASGSALFSALMAAGLPIQKEAQANAPISDEPHFLYKRGKVQKIKRTGNKVVDRFNRLQALGAAKGTTERKVISPGNLRKSIARKRLKSGNGVTGANIGISWRGSAFYGRFKEFGTSKMAAEPFLRPAFDSKKEEALTILKEKLAANIEKQRQKIAQRTESLR